MTKVSNDQDTNELPYTLDSCNTESIRRIHISPSKDGSLSVSYPKLCKT